MKTLTIAGAKGGTGKSTTAACLACEMGMRGLRVLLVDTDPQATVSIWLTGSTPADPWDQNPVSYTANGALPQIDVLRSSRERIMAGKHEHDRYFQDVAVGDYDLRIIDCPPSLSPAVESALEQGDLALIPFAPAPLELGSLTDVSRFIRDLNTPAPPVKAVLTRVISRRVMNRSVLEYLDEVWPGTTYETQIPHDQRAIDAVGEGETVVSYAPRCRAALSYRLLAGHLSDDLHLPTPGRRRRLARRTR